jgi:sulfhydrogenase subunit alpha
MNAGTVASTSGLNISVTDYEQYFEESHAAHSTALHSTFLGDASSADANEASGVAGIYHVGPLARVNLNRQRLSESARQVADEIGFVTPCNNPYKAIIARGLELIHAYEESLQILQSYQPESEPRIHFEPSAGEGMSATEAPRGLLYHRYQIDDRGQVTFAKIVPPTSQNQRQIEDDLKQLLPSVLSDDDRATAGACERLIRTYDPCISCSTHFLKLTLERR